MPPALYQSSIKALQFVSGKLLIMVGCVLLVSGCQSSLVSDDEDFSFSSHSGKARYFKFDGSQPEPSAEARAPLAYKDIWSRVRAGFQLQNVPENARIAQHKKRFTDNPASLRVVSKRSAPYIHYIVERLEEQNMPLELALLPIIESSYNPFAYSSAKAAGLWQFVPSTGQYYNLRQTSWYDGRRDITASTNAALRYLSYLHDYFNGDWLLAIAAYNAGEGTVGKAIETNQRLGKPTDYWNLPLPQETRDYVPKLLAVSKLVLNPQQHGITLASVPDEPYFEVVRLNRRLNLAHAAKLAELEEDELFRLNPAFTKGVTQDGPKQLLVPAEKAELLSANLAKLGSAPAEQLADAKDLPEPVLNWDFPERQDATPRYRLSRQLREINQVLVQEIQSTQTLASGPVRTTRIEHVLNPVSTRPISVARINSIIIQQPDSGVASSSRNGDSKTYKVKAGETLHQISKAQKVSVADLQRWNKLSGTNVKVGQVLQIQAPLSASAQTAKATKGSVVAQNAAKKRPATMYKVKKGDSIQQIARRFNVEPKNVQNWNQLSGRDLKPGQLLTLYLPD